MATAHKSPASADPSSPALYLVDGKPRASSLTVAEHFGKRHRDVLRSVRDLEVSEMFRERNFALSEYRVPGSFRPYQKVDMTRDGFVLVVMGFTGKAAMVWKMRYIEEFNRMEDELRAAPALSRRTTAQERNPLAVLVNQYLGRLGPSRNNYTTFWRKTFHPVFGVNSVEELTIDQLPKAVAFMEALLAASASAIPLPEAPAAPKKRMGRLDMFVAGTVSSEFSISKDKFMPEVWEGYSLAERMLKNASCEGDNARAAREMLQLEGYALESHYTAACAALHAYERALFRVDRLVKIAAVL